MKQKSDDLVFFILDDSSGWLGVLSVDRRADLRILLRGSGDGIFSVLIMIDDLVDVRGGCGPDAPCQCRDLVTLIPGADEKIGHTVIRNFCPVRRVAVGSRHSVSETHIDAQEGAPVASAPQLLWGICENLVARGAMGRSSPLFPVIEAARDYLEGSPDFVLVSGSGAMRIAGYRPVPGSFRVEQPVPRVLH